MKKIYRTYVDSYRGLSRPVWMLAIVMLINRTGAMVLPFLGIYMTSELGFTLEETGFVLGCFGLGAVAGSVAGGWLTDKLGHFRVQAASLFLAVPVFILMPFFSTVYSLACLIFLLSCITETFRPANSVSISSYALPQNITRAFSLNRMALNLGFSIGPALGGFLAAISYHLLFFGNATSSFLAGIVFYLYFYRREKRIRKVKDHHAVGHKGLSPWRDGHFLLFTIFCMLYGLCFFQFLSTLPLYYKDVYRLSNVHIGLLLAFNGVVVFGLEMLLVSMFERLMKPHAVILTGSVLCAAAFAILPLGESVALLYLSMFLLSVSEILAMPFMATISIHRAGERRQGAYMGVNGLSFSGAHILSPILGTWMATHFGFSQLWLVTAGVAVFTAIGFYWNQKYVG